MHKNQINLAEKVAVVTGGAQGIGLAVAERMLQSGAQVVLWDLDPEANAKSAELLSALGPVSAVTVDVSDWDSVQSALRTTIRQAGQVDILVNSAGIAGPNATVEDYDNDAWRRILDITSLEPIL